MLKIPKTFVILKIIEKGQEVHMRGKFWKRTLSVLLALLMTFTAVPVTAGAEEKEAETLVNIAGEAEVSICSTPPDANPKDNVKDGNWNTIAGLYKGTITGYEAQYPSQEAPYNQPWLQMDFAEAKSNVKKIVLGTLKADNANQVDAYQFTCTVFAKSSEEETYNEIGASVLKRSDTAENSAWTLELETPLTVKSLVVRLGNGKGNGWPLLTEVEIYQDQAKTEEVLVNVAPEAAAVSIQGAETANPKKNVNDGNRASVAGLYRGSITDYQKACAGQEEPYDLPWIQLDFAQAKENIRKIIVATLKADNANQVDTYQFTCTVYAKSGDDAAWEPLGEQTLKRSDTEENSMITLDLSDAPKTVKSLVVRLGNAAGNGWPLLNEVEIYQGQTKTEEPVENLTNVASEATFTVPSSQGSSTPDKMVDGNPSTLWINNGANWPCTVEIQLPAANTKCVKKVVLKFESHADRSMDVSLKYALNGVTSDLIAVDGSEKTAILSEGYEYVFESPQAMSHLYVTLANPLTGGAAGQFWPAIAEVEVYVDNGVEEVVNLENIAATRQQQVTMEESVNESADKYRVVDGDFTTSAPLHTKTFSEIEAENGTLPFVEVRLDVDQKIRQFVLGMKEDASGAAYDFTIYGKKRGSSEYAEITSGSIGTSSENNNTQISVSDLTELNTKEVEYQTLKVVFAAGNEAAKSVIPHLSEFQLLANEAALNEADLENIAWKTTALHTNYNQDTVERIVDGNKTNTWTAKQYPAYVDIGLDGEYSLSEIEVYTPSQGYSQYSLYYSKDGQNYSKLAEKTSKDSCPAEGEVYPANGVTASSVRILLEYHSENEKAVLNEIRIKGNRIGDAKKAVFAAPVAYADSGYDVDVTAQDTIEEVKGIISRNVGAAYTDWFTFVLGEEGTYDYYEIEDAPDGKIQITGNDGVSLASGLNYYLKYYCNVSITQVGNQVKMPAAVVPVGAKVHKECKVPVRYAYNYCTMSYSMPFWGESEWRKELDWLALNGVNLVLDITGQEEVWREFLDTLGYSHEDIKDYIAGPAYYAWAYMANLSGYGGPVHDSWFTSRTELARKNQLIMRKLGMQPVLQGYSGMVPVDIAQKAKGDYALGSSDVIAQGGWCSFQRPYMLRTTSAAYQKYAKLFYQCQEQVYGKVSDYYATDPFHEGGNTGGMNTADVSRNVLAAMMEYNPEAVWVIQSWQGNPSNGLLSGLEGNREHALVLDLYAEKTPHWNETNANKYGGGNFANTPFVYCMLNNFGGRMGLHGHMDNIVSGVVTAANTSPVMSGIGIAPEGSQNNPVLYDLLFETVWCEDASQDLTEINTEEWLKKYVTRRYGAESENAYQAMRILENTVYKASFNNLGQGAPESYVNARPNTSISAASTWGNAVISYDMAELEKAAKLLLQDYEQLKDSDGYLYDLADILKQVLSNTAQSRHSQMVAALNAGDLEAFTAASDEFLALIDKVEEVLGTREEFLLGTWVERAKALADGADEFSKDLYEFNAKALVTTWGAYPQAESGGLKDYSNRQWAGLTRDFYKERWSMWIARQKEALAGNNPGNINWFAFEWAWARANTEYTTKASGADLQALGREILKDYSSITPAADDSNDYPVEKMTLKEIGSQESTKGDDQNLAKFVLDGDTSTYWHTSWTNDDQNSYDNHYLVLELEEETELAGLRYLPRQDGAVNGIITGYEIYVSSDGETYELAAQGNWAADKNWKLTAFSETKKAKYVKFVTTAAQSVNNNKFSSAAEIRLTVPQKEESVGKLGGYTLSLKGNIGINFYMELNQSVAESGAAYMQFTLPDGSVQKIPAKDAVKTTMGGKTYYVFSCDVAAKEMTDEIRAQVVVPGDAEDETRYSAEYTYSVKQYADYLFAHKDGNEEYERAAELIKSMLNYGSYAQKYFSHNVDALANEADYITEAEKDVSGVTAELLEAYRNSAEQKNDFVKFEGSNLVLLSQTTLKLYFTLDEAKADQIVFTCARGGKEQELKKTKSGQYYFVEITDIAAKDLDEEYTVTISDGETDFQVTYSVMAYCYNVLTREITDQRTKELKDVIAALYLYNQEANVYFEP